MSKSNTGGKPIQDMDTAARIDTDLEGTVAEGHLWLMCVGKPRTVLK